MKRIFVFLIFCLLCLSLVKAYTFTEVQFNGDWNNGTILTSNWYKVSNGTFYAKNAYPIREEGMNKRVKVCDTTYLEKSRRVCEKVFTGYKDKTKRICYRQGNKRYCERIVYQVEVYKRQCHIEHYLKPKTKCKYIYLSDYVKIGCMNPSGVYTNALLYENFEYKIYGENIWKPMPTTILGLWEVLLNNKWVQFRVIIPEECSPKYDINKAVFIVEQ